MKGVLDLAHHHHPAAIPNPAKGHARLRPGQWAREAARASVATSIASRPRVQCLALCCADRTNSIHLLVSVEFLLEALLLHQRMIRPLGFALSRDEFL